MVYFQSWYLRPHIIHYGIFLKSERVLRQFKTTFISLSMTNTCSFRSWYLGLHNFYKENIGFFLVTYISLQRSIFKLLLSKAYELTNLCVDTFQNYLYSQEFSETGNQPRFEDGTINRQTVHFVS